MREQVIAYLKSKNNFLILTHKNPDGDTIGSAVALCAMLRQIGKTAFIANNPDTKKNLAVYANSYFAAAEYSYESVISVDIATSKLLPDIYKNITIDVKIDHHPKGDEFAEICYSESDKGACGEIIYSLVESIGAKMSQEIALPLFLAISTDTGCFQYANTSPSNLRIAANLMDTGIDTANLIKTFFLSRTPQRFMIEGKMVENMIYLHEKVFAITYLSQEMIKSIGAIDDDIDGLSALPRTLSGVKWGAVIREEKGGFCRVSVRSNEEYPANKMCEVLGGGGHLRAAGCRIEQNLQDTIELILSTAKRIYFDE